MSKLYSIRRFLTFIFLFDIFSVFIDRFVFIISSLFSDSIVYEFVATVEQNKKRENSKRL